MGGSDLSGDHPGAGVRPKIFLSQKNRLQGCSTFNFGDGANRPRIRTDLVELSTIASLVGETTFFFLKIKKDAT